MAAQLTTVNGRSLRGLLKWMALARSSFPVPLNPGPGAVSSRGSLTMKTCGG